MDADLKHHSEYEKYGELWKYNLEKIDGIHRDIENSLQDLENRYVHFETIYEKLDEMIHVLSSIYSGFNIIDGNEQIMRLIALLKSYRERYTREGINFNLINGLLLRIAELRDRSFAQFPAMGHKSITIGPSGPRPIDSDYLSRPFKWITFQRNRSWFMAPFNDCQIIKSTYAERVSAGKQDYISVRIENKEYRIKDIFLHSTEDTEEPLFIILLNNRLKNYTADRIGKKMYSGEDIITPEIKPFNHGDFLPFSPGRIKIFGENHIYLN